MYSPAHHGPVLLVEDDENDAFFFQRAFRKTGCDSPLHVAPDGLEAIHYLAGKGEYGDRVRYPLPVLIVLDLNTPRRHGLEVLQWIRSQPALQRLLVVVLTSSNADVDVEASYALGANSYLLKPTEPDRFLHVVHLIVSYWLGLNRPAAPPPAPAEGSASAPPAG